MRSSDSRQVDGVRRSLVLWPWAFVHAWALVRPRSLVSTKDQPQDQPWFGTWQQLPPATKWFNPSPYRKVTLRIEPWEDGLKVVYDMVRRRGGITHLEWTGRFDGKNYAVQGVDYVLTNAYRQLSDRSYEIVVSVDGRTAAVATAVVSPDGRQLTVDTVERDAGGKTLKTRAVYVKQ